MDEIDVLFEKDITTRYKPRKKGNREAPEFEIESEKMAEYEGDEILKIEPKPKVRKLKKQKNKKPTLILEEAEEALEKPEEEIVNIEEIVFPEEEIEIIPVKKRKTKKQREQKLKVNPPGKKGTRSKLPENVEIID